MSEDNGMAEFITLTAEDGHILEAYLAGTAGDAKGRLVVIQEVFGVNGHIRDVCTGFAAEGYVALAPALFDRAEPAVELDYTDSGLGRGRELRALIPWDDVARDVRAAQAYLAREGAAAIVGYCWGGSVAWLGASEADFACAVGYYGGQIVDLLERTPGCPTMLHFGEIDPAIPPADVETIRAAHSEVTVHVYAGADHGFNCDRRAHYHAEAAALARKRTLAFFAQHLG